jgi:hypothetical protein
MIRPALLLILVVLWTRPIPAASPLDSYPALMDTLIGGNFAAAAAMCDTLAADFPASPAAVYAKAAVLYAHMIDREDTLGRAEFFVLTKQCIRDCDQGQRRPGANPAELAFLKGSALASQGLLLHHEGRTLAGLKSLISSKGEFDKAIAADPAFYDAYLGRGAYRYGVARNASLVSWLPFIPSAEAGWDDLWLAVYRSKFSRFSALTSIVWFVLDDQNYVLADSICNAGLARFPGSRNFLWPQLSLYERQQAWDKVMDIAHLILNQYLALPDNNGYETTGLYWRLMRCADALGRGDQAVDFARAGLVTFRTPDAARRRHTKLNDMQARLTQDPLQNK